jgi:hypothetical protein
MEHFSEGQVLQSLKVTIRVGVSEFYTAIEQTDLLPMGELAVEDAFVLFTTADAVGIEPCTPGLIRHKYINPTTINLYCSAEKV